MRRPYLKARMAGARGSSKAAAKRAAVYGGGFLKHSAQGRSWPWDRIALTALLAAAYIGIGACAARSEPHGIPARVPATPTS